MEVHPPEHGIHSWRDFLVHMGTITLGLLIAIGLEQTVECFHHRHQRHMLLESLDNDSEQQIIDSERVHKSVVLMKDWLSVEIAGVRDAMDTHQMFTAQPIPRSSGDFDLPMNPNFLAAKSAGTLSLLSQREITAYTEVSDTTEVCRKVFEIRSESRQHLLAFRSSFSRDHSPSPLSPDFSRATAEDLRRYLDLLNQAYIDSSTFDFWAQSVHGAGESVLHGERDLKKIQAAERQPFTWAPR